MKRETIKKVMELNAEIETRQQESSKYYRKALDIIDYGKDMDDYNMGYGGYPDETVTISIRLDLLNNKTRNTLGNAILAASNYMDKIRAKLEKELEEL